MNIQGQGHLLTLAKGHLYIKFKTKLNFLRNHFTNQSQILYVLSLGRGNHYINGLGQVTKMAAMPIYGKNLKKSSLELLDRFQ